MTRRPPLFLLVALVAATLLAATPLAAQTTDPQPHDQHSPTEPMTEPAAEAEVGERMERAEEGTLEGSIVLLDADNLIVETAEGDRAFSIRETSQLPAELRDAEAWASYRGVPVRVTFAPGQEGELRVVRTLSMVDDGTMATTETTASGTTAPRTDLADESQVVEPTRLQPTAGTTEATERTVTTTTTAPDGRTAGEAIAEANGERPADDREMDTAAGFAADDQAPPAGERMASLPATASSLPWLGLIGTLALLGAVGLGRLETLRRRRVAIDGRRR